MRGTQLFVPLGVVLLACQSTTSDGSALPDLAQPATEPVAVFAAIGGVT